MQNPRFLLIAIAALFTAPLLLAILMRSSWWDFKPAELSNRGTLVQPPYAIDPASLVPVRENQETNHSANWRVLMLFDGNCQQDCRETLAGLRQVHIASGRDQDAISLWLVSAINPEPSVIDEIIKIYPKFELFHDGNATIADALHNIDGQAEEQGKLEWRGETFVLDPATHIILRYDPGYEPGDLAEDLDRLLTWSAQD